eukprot:3797416-Pleurochrysis_carterae.AAC.1
MRSDWIVLDLLRFAQRGWPGLGTLLRAVVTSTRITRKNSKPRDGVGGCCRDDDGVCVEGKYIDADNDGGDDDGGDDDACDDDACDDDDCDDDTCGDDDCGDDADDDGDCCAMPISPSGDFAAL